MQKNLQAISTNNMQNSVEYNKTQLSFFVLQDAGKKFVDFTCFLNESRKMQE